MIFSTNHQVNCFLIFVFLGIIFSIFYNCINILFFKNFTKNYKKIIKNSVFYSIFSIFFVILLNFFNFGLFSISLLLATFAGYVWTNLTIKKLVVFLQTLWYNKLTKDKIKYARKKN